MRYSKLGGQAVIEGVMMKHEKEYSVAVRKPDGGIEVTKKATSSIRDKYKIASLPIIRGMVIFAESLSTGMKTLNYSASFFEEEEKEAHYHHEEGHHHHHHEGGEVEEYGIGTFVYYRRPAFDIHKFDHYVATKWPRSVIRAKGVCYFSHNRDMSFLFEQAGIQKKITEAGQWYATAPEEDMIELMRQEPGLLRDWDEQYGDRMLKIVFIGQNMDKEQIIRDLDKCLE